MKISSIISFLLISILTILNDNNIIKVDVNASPTSYRGRSPKLRVNFSETNQVKKRQNNDTGGGFSWGHDPMRGVNIGGWLVLEPWITPSLFLDKPDWVVDEWTYGVYMSYQDDTMGEIRNHWNTWFKYQELKDIAAVGLNTIRIQIGFWSVIPLQNGEPYLVGAYDYLKLAVTWAASLGLKVMIDLHGAPGGQNSWDNSGIRGVREWFYNDTNIERTLDALSTMTNEFVKDEYQNTVIAIEVMNEPFPNNPNEVNILKSFYQAAYSRIRDSAQGRRVTVALDQAYQGLYVWENFMMDPDYWDVAMDTHIYSMFDLNLLSMGYNANLDWYCSQVDYLRQSNNIHWTIVGEWTPANTDCAFWLNGKGRGARYDNTLTTSDPLQFPGDCSAKTGSDPSKFSAEYVDYLARSFEIQSWVYEQASGYVVWTWKTEQASDWSMQTGITYGWVPNPITAKPHGTPCTNHNYSSSNSTSSDSISSSIHPGLSHLIISIFIGQLFSYCTVNLFI